MKEDKRLKILSTLEFIIKSKMYHEVTLDEVAKQASIGKGTIYRYFKNKEDLFVELAINGFTNIRQEINKVADSKKDFRSKLTEMTVKFDQFSQKRRVIVNIMQDIQNRMHEIDKEFENKIITEKRLVRLALSRIFAEGLSKDLLLLNISANQYAEFWIHMVIGLSHWDPEVQKIDMDYMISTHFGE